MARWRAEAARRLPELRGMIDAAPALMGLWDELFSAFEKAYRADPRDESLISRIYSFADWCAQAPRDPDPAHDPLSAVVTAFYEDIPTCPPARDDMPRWFRYSDVARHPEVFGYMLDPEEYDELVRFMAANQRRYQPRAGAPAHLP